MTWFAVFAALLGAPAFAAPTYSEIRNLGATEPTGNLVFTAAANQKLIVCAMAEEAGTPNFEIVTFTVGGQAPSTHNLVDIVVAITSIQCLEWDAATIAAMTGGGTYAISYADDGTAVDVFSWVAILVDNVSQDATVIDTEIENPQGTSLTLDNASAADTLNFAFAATGDDATEVNSWGTGLIEVREYKPTNFWSGWAADADGDSDPYTVTTAFSDFWLAALMTFAEPAVAGIAAPLFQDTFHYTPGRPSNGFYRGP